MIFVATKEGRTANFFSSYLLLLLLNPGFGIQDGLKPGSGINISDPQHWFSGWYSHVTNKSSQTGSSHTQAINRSYFPAYCIPVTGGYCQFAGSASALVYKPTCVGIYHKKYVFFFIDKSEEPLKVSKTCRAPYLGQDLTIHVNKRHIHLMTQTL